MAKVRREKTLADYVVIAISPALIMLLVGSLSFFLLEASYAGEHRERMQWVLFWFVFGAVLVARIGIEQSPEYAGLFGGVLAAAAGLFCLRFLDSVVIAGLLLAVISWCSWKLTWDCTLIDDSEDASGEGLLQAAGLDQESADRSNQNGTLPSKVAQPDEDSETVSEDRPKRAHAPGLWVIYFSLAALPLFGIGQLFIPAADAGRRSWGFQLLAVYVASALGLLLTTSFLGLRRYLRQRKLQMPAAMTRAWLGMGAGLALVLLLLALLLPRPQGEYSVTGLVDKLDAKVREASQYAMLGKDRGEGEGRRIGQQDPQAQKPGEGGKPADRQAEPQGKDQQTDGKRDEHAASGKSENQPGKPPQDGGSGKSSGQGKQQSQQSGQQQQGQQKAPQQGQPQAQPGQPKQQGQEQQNGGKGRNQPAQQPQAPQPQTPPTPPSSNWLGWFASWFRWLIYSAMAIAVLILAYRNRHAILGFLSRLWAELLNLWNSLWGWKAGAAEGETGGNAAPAVPPRPFASYENPFFSGADRRMTPAQLTLYTYEALEAWSREQAVERSPDQTPLEFADELGRRVPALAKDAGQTAQLYSRVVYARKEPGRESMQVLERLWRRLQAAG